MFASRIAARLSAKTLARRTYSNYKSGNNTAFFQSLRYVVAVGGVAFVAGAIADNACASDIDAIKKDIVKAIDSEDSRRGDGTSIAPTLVRLAWHAAGTYDATSKTGGSNGATMRFPPECQWGANAGLKCARDFLEPIKAKYPAISYADLWTLAGTVAIENMGGPSIPWRCGRSDSDKPTTVPDGRLPDADKGNPKSTAQHIRDIFGRMGFNDREMVALIGAHAVGRCHPEASGYWGPWTNAESTFSNEFFRLLLEEKWTVKKTHKGGPWKGPMQYENSNGSLMMLPADLALVQDAGFRKYVEMYAKDEDLFFKDFSAAFSKLMELGVSFSACPFANKSKGLLGLGFFGL